MWDLLKKLNKKQLFVLCLAVICAFIQIVCILGIIAPETLPSFFGMFKNV